MRTLILFLALGAHIACAQNPQPYIFTLRDTEIEVDDYESEDFPDDIIFAEIEFTITAIGQDAWFTRSGITGQLRWTNTGLPNPRAFSFVLEPERGTHVVGNNIHIRDGETRRLIYSVAARPSQSSFYFVSADSMEIASTQAELLAGNTTRYQLPADFETDSQFAAGIPELSTSLLLFGGFGILGLVRRRK